MRKRKALKSPKNQRFFPPPPPQVNARLKWPPGKGGKFHFPTDIFRCVIYIYMYIYIYIYIYIMYLKMFSDLGDIKLFTLDFPFLNRKEGGTNRKIAPTKLFAIGTKKRFVNFSSLSN